MWRRGTPMYELKSPSISKYQEDMYSSGYLTFEQDKESYSLGNTIRSYDSALVAALLEDGRRWLVSYASQVPLLTYEYTGPHFVSFTLYSMASGTVHTTHYLLTCNMPLTSKAKCEVGVISGVTKGERWRETEGEHFLVSSCTSYSPTTHSTIWMGIWPLLVLCSPKKCKLYPWRWWNMLMVHTPAFIIYHQDRKMYFSTHNNTEVVPYLHIFLEKTFPGSSRGHRGFICHNRGSIPRTTSSSLGNELLIWLWTYMHFFWSPLNPHSKPVHRTVL